MTEAPDRPTITALICTLREEDSLPHVLPIIPDWVDEVLLVDAHSDDGTVEVARRLRPDIRILYQPGAGKGDALKHGVENARGDIIVTLDADGATDPREMHRFIEPLLQGCHFAKGTRLAGARPSNMPRHRWFGNRVLALATNLLYGTRYTDVCSGYNGFWKKAFLNLHLKNDGFEMEQEMNARISRNGARVTEVPHQDRGRLGGASKTSSLRQGVRNLIVIAGQYLRGE